MSPKAKAIAIVAAAAGLPYFTFNVWARYVPYIPALYDVIFWAISLAPALVAAFKAGPAAARAGLVVQAISSVVLLRVAVIEVLYRVDVHPHMVAPFFLAIGAGVAWKMIPALDEAKEPAPQAPAPQAPAPPQPPPLRGGGGGGGGRSKAKLFLIVLGVLALLGALGGSIYVLHRAFTRLDRELFEVEHASGGTKERYDYLGQHGEDPRVHEYFKAQLLRAGGSSLSAWEFDQLADGMKAAFAKKKPDDSKELVESIVLLVIRDEKELPKEWLPCPWDDARVNDAVLARLIAASQPSAWDFPEKRLAALLGEFDRRKIPVTDEVVSAVVRLWIRTNGAAGEEWLDRNAKDGARANAMRKLVVDSYKDSYTAQPDPERKKKLDFLSAEIKRRCTDASQEGVVDAWMQIYLNGWPKELDPVVRSLTGAAPRRFRERSAKEKNFHEKHITLVLACISGHGEPDDVKELLAQSVRPPILDGDHWKKLEAAGFPPAIERTADEPWFHHTTLRALVSIGKPGIAQLTSGLSIKTREAVRLCALALTQVEPAALVPEVEKQLDAYSRKAPLLAAAQAEILGRGSEIVRAREILHEVHPLSEALAEGLLAIEKVAETDRVDLCFMRGLSSTDEAVAKHCANVLRKRLDRDKFIDVLFRFLVHKETFDVREVAVYEDAVKDFGVPASSGLVRNLEKLLEQANGNPAKVYWIHKVIALRCLAVVGDADAKPTIDKYVKDPGNYIHIETKTDPKTKRVLDRKETEVPFRELCLKALDAIGRRK